MGKVPGKVICAGELLDEDGKTKGSFLIPDLPGKAELDVYLKSEPYIQEKVWEKVEVEQLNVVIVNDEKVGQ